jgi:predicted RNA-binding protein with TRAM domain
MSDDGWRKSSFSAPRNSNCVEVWESWRTSSYTNHGGGNCVETRLSVVRWSKSSRSSAQSPNCVEVGEAWHKSSYSAPQNANCVEVAETPREVLVRDTQNRGDGHLAFSAVEWVAFVKGTREGAL